MAERGHWYPPLIAFTIGTILTSWAAYALAGAGVIHALPLTKYALAGIAAVFLLRAFLFPLLKPAFPDNSQAFWLTTSFICFVIGSGYLIGALTAWQVSLPLK
jgi:cell division protein FtsX